MSRLSTADFAPRLSLHARVAALAVLMLCAAGAAAEGNTLVPAGHAVFAPGSIPDRVVLVAGAQAATQAAVAWRTSAGDVTARAQIAVAGHGPGFADSAVDVDGETIAVVTDNGRALHHQVRFTDLAPKTLYAYRVRGHDTWSEWFQFRTASASAEPFSFLYVGDAQNRVRSHFSRVIRQAFRGLPDAQLVIHAGDLVNTRGGNHDDEWGEWFVAGGHSLAMTANLPAAGNHEYGKGSDDEYIGLSPNWRPQFPVPGNGVDGLASTTYHVDIQGVRFVVLDSTAALELDNIDRQTQWLERVLAGSEARWTVVVHHHPMLSVAAGRDNAPLRDQWQPLYERHGVDLVLQGHDHAYGRAALPVRAADPGASAHGTMYVVSVSGPKQYLLSERAHREMDHVGEDTQLYQIVHVQDDRLRYESRTATGDLYDAFDLVRRRDGGIRVVEREAGRIAPRRCAEPETDDRCRSD